MQLQRMMTAAVLMLALTNCGEEKEKKAEPKVEGGSCQGAENENLALVCSLEPDPQHRSADASLVVVESAAALPECNEERKFQVFYTGESKLFYACDSQGEWEAIDLQAVVGEEGMSSLVKIEEESAGETCAESGQKISVGRDTNSDGVLEEAEIEATAYLCAKKMFEQEEDEDLQTVEGFELSPKRGSRDGWTIIKITNADVHPFDKILVGGELCDPVDFAERPYVECMTRKHAPGVVPVTWQASNGEAKLIGEFEYFDQAPSETFTISPSTGGALGGNTIQVGHPKDIPGSIQVFVGGEECEELGLGSDSISCETPSGAVGTVSVVVRKQHRADLKVGEYTYIDSDLPQASDFTLSKASGSLEGWTALNITSDVMKFGDEIYLGDALCSTVMDWVGTIDCVTPAGSSAGSVDVKWKRGSQSVVIGSFEYIDTPASLEGAEATITPTTGPTSGSTYIQIQLGSLLDMDKVTIGGKTCNEAGNGFSPGSRWYDCNAPANPAGVADIFIHLGTRQSLKVGEFTYTD